MSTKSLVVVKFGDTVVNFYRHWGGDPVIVGSEMLDMLASAQSIKPREHFHTGSYLLRLMFQDGDDEGQLPTYQAWITNGRCGGDWDQAYMFECVSGGAGEGEERWRIGHVAGCFGERWAAIAKKAQWFSPEEFRAFVDQKFADDQARGAIYDIQMRDTLFGRGCSAAPRQRRL